MEPREVVTVFLQSRGRILLLRRSGKVGTYQGKWAGVSGYLEQAPPAQALQEIREETSLAPGDVALVRQGAPVEVEDPENRRLWRIHPFLARVEAPEKIRLDWENVEMRWVRPEEVAGMDTVPALAEVLRAVLD